MTLPERLRARTRYVGWATQDLLNEAAARIEELERQLSKASKLAAKLVKEKVT